MGLLAVGPSDAQVFRVGVPKHLLCAECVIWPLLRRLPRGQVERKGVLGAVRLTLQPWAQELCLEGYRITWWFETALPIHLDNSSIITHF